MRKYFMPFSPQSWAINLLVSHLGVPQILSFVLIILCCQVISAQTTTLYGDFKVADVKGDSVAKPLTYDLILYTDGGVIAARQTVSNGGRYRFMNLPSGVYFIAVELENTEITRIRVELLRSIYKAEFRQDVELEWKSHDSKPNKVRNISADDFYARTGPMQKRFERAQSAADSKMYDQASDLFKSLTSEDPNDFQAWTELGTVYLAQNKPADAQKAYAQAISVKPGFFLALFNLGRLRVMQKDYEGAIEPLTQAVEKKPDSAAANYYLGESYLQIKKGSKAVVFFDKALKLDPVGMADAHLRLATLYNAVGLKEKAATEYEEFLKKKPDYVDKKKLQDYISANKKP